MVEFPGLIAMSPLVSVPALAQRHVLGRLCVLTLLFLALSANALNLSSAGAITGSATTNGTYTFSAKATDSGAPPQTKTVQETIRVGDPVVITSSPRLPDACLHQPYSFTRQTSGGIPPLLWTFFSNSWVLPLDQTTGTFSGTPAILGTFTGSVGATTNGDGQQISLTVKSCP